MRSFLHTFLLICGLSVVLAACDKADELTTYDNGSAVTLSASSANLAPQPADSNNVALTLNWTSPNYATDSANYKFIIEIDSAGKNFPAPFRKEVMKSMSASFIAKELNSFLVNRGYAFNVPVDMDVRVISSYANNNERYTSNTVKIRMTPYKVPPKIALPASGRLFIVGDASTFGWNNDPAPAFPPAREFARLNETTFAGIFYMNGSGGYKLLQTQGVWDTQFHMVSGGNATEGSFVQENADPSFPSPSPAGWYKLIVDFQTGKYSVTPFDGTLPAGDLFIVGNATPGGDATGWNNPVPVPSQQFTRLNSSEWEITLPMNGGKEFLVLPSNGDWDKKYALENTNAPGSAQGGEFGYHQDGQPDPDIFKNNFKGPATSGNYKITLNFAAPTTTPGASGRYSIVPQ